MPDIMYNGKVYEVDEDALAQMSKEGIKYSLAPTPTPSSNDPGFWSKAAETVGDTARGGAHGFSMGLSDAKFGQDNESLMQRMGLADYNDVAARSPIASTAGDIGGSMLGVGKLGAAAKGAHWAAKAGKAALGSGVESLVREAAEQGQSGDVGEAIESGAEGAAAGGGISASLSGLGAAMGGKTVKAGADILGKLVREGSDTARNKAFGLGVKDMKDLAKKRGVSGTQLASDTAAELESLVPSPKWGSTASDKGEALETIQDKMGADIGASLDQAGRVEGLDSFIKPSSGSPGSWAAIQQKLATDASGLPQSSPGENALFNAANGFSDRLQNEAAPNSLGGLHKRVSDWGKEAYGATKNKSVTTLSDTAAGQAAEMGRDVGRDELGTLIHSYATPGTAQAFDDSMKGYSRVADFTRAAQDRGTIEAANTKAMGLGVGALAPVMTLATTGSIPAAAVAGGMALHSGTRNFLTQAAETSRGYDVLANAGRHMTPKIAAAPAKLQGMGQSLATQGNRPGVVGAEGMWAPYVNDDEDNY